jgi:hypothetical protein
MKRSVVLSVLAAAALGLMSTGPIAHAQATSVRVALSRQPVTDVIVDITNRHSAALQRIVIEAGTTSTDWHLEAGDAVSPRQTRSLKFLQLAPAEKLENEPRVALAIFADGHVEGEGTILQTERAARDAEAADLRYWIGAASTVISLPNAEAARRLSDAAQHQPIADRSRIAGLVAGVASTFAGRPPGWVATWSATHLAHWKRDLALVERSLRSLQSAPKALVNGAGLSWVVRTVPGARIVANLENASARPVRAYAVELTGSAGSPRSRAGFSGTLCATAPQRYIAPGETREVHVLLRDDVPPDRWPALRVAAVMFDDGTVEGASGIRDRVAAEPPC